MSVFSFLFFFVSVHVDNQFVSPQSFLVTFSFFFFFYSPAISCTPASLLHQFLISFHFSLQFFSLLLWRLRCLEAAQCPAYIVFAVISLSLYLSRNPITRISTIPKELPWGPIQYSWLIRYFDLLIILLRILLNSLILIIDIHFIKTLHWIINCKTVSTYLNIMHWRALDYLRLS